MADGKKTIYFTPADYGDFKPTIFANPIIVAEFTTNHMGNLNVLLEMVKQAKLSGANVIKMQKKDVDSFYTEEKLNSPYPSPYGKTYRDYRRIFEFNHEDFVRFDECCRQHEIPWYATIQDVASVKFFENFKMPMVKIASCNTINEELIQAIKDTFDVPIVISIGGTSLGRIDTLVDLFSDRLLYLQQCTSTYPCPPQETYLANILALKDRYPQPNVRVGYSGHEIGWAPTLIAAHMGAEIIERHFCLSRDSFVHHIDCSLEPKEFFEMVLMIRHLPSMTKTVQFGMKKSEEKFLVNNTYGTDELKGNWTCSISSDTDKPSGT